MEKIVTTAKGHTVRVWQNPDYDGSLSWEGVKTLRRFRELTEKRSQIPVEKYGLFFAFSDDQFKKGYDGLVKRGLITQGGTVKSFGLGVYGTREAFDRWLAECKAIDKQIVAECDPYEVYLEEYNNYECCIDGDGDRRAVMAVVNLFGAETAVKVLRPEVRFRRYGILSDLVEKEGGR